MDALLSLRPWLSWAGCGGNGPRRDGGRRRARRVAGAEVHVAGGARLHRSGAGQDRADRRRGGLREHLGDGPLLPDRDGRCRGGADAEGYSALNFIAGVTERAKLGTLVTGVQYRHPGILLKTVTTLDVLSGGRAYLGIGAGWYERESRGLGVPFPPTAERFERLEETLQIAHRMWSDETGPYEGEHYRLEEPMNNPPPVSGPRPPLMVGGMGGRKTLRLGR